MCSIHDKCVEQTFFKKKNILFWTGSNLFYIIHFVLCIVFLLFSIRPFVIIVHVVQTNKVCCIYSLFINWGLTFKFDFILTL